MPSTDLAHLAAPARTRGGKPRLNRRQKAAIIVQFLLNEGADLPLKDLPEDLQGVLTTQMGAMRYVDRETLGAVLAEFAEQIEAMGLTFPGGMAGALSTLDGRISPQTAARLRKEAGVRQFGDPWVMVSKAPPDKLLEFLENEATEVAAILLSKLDVGLAAKLLGRVPGPVARRITYAMQLTHAATPDAVDRIGLSLASQLTNVPPMAFADGADQRVGAILNFSPAATREDVLAGLEQTDEGFARLVRRAIFTFANIPDRVTTTDVPLILRDIPRPALLNALSAALAEGEDLARAANFLLDNTSQRLRDALRDEIEELPTVPAKEGEVAMTEAVNTIRQLEAAGEIKLIAPVEPET